MKRPLLANRCGKDVAILSVGFPYNAGWRLDYERENRKTFSSGTAAVRLEKAGL